MDIGLASKGILIEITELFSISSPTPHFMKASVKACTKAFRKAYSHFADVDSRIDRLFIRHGESIVDGCQHQSQPG